ncbi:AIPR family protein [Nocardia wallacei]|uniref:AIPR family protein n=1 Tax=Nocardia wallacei TaxID=480035 RepID=UPI0024565972|nr:AIPR family protein [Nocardia wallacei]
MVKKVDALGPTGVRVGERLRELRHARGLTLNALAAKLEEAGRPIDWSALAKMEKGQRRIDVDDLLALALALNAPPNWLLFSHNENETSLQLTPAVQLSTLAAWSWATQDLNSEAASPHAVNVPSREAYGGTRSTPGGYGDSAGVDPARINVAKVRQVSAALHAEFDSLIDAHCDFYDINSGHGERIFLCRALSALAVRQLTGCSSASAAEAVIDGPGDGGIDAFALDHKMSTLFLVQAKWSSGGSARMDYSSAVKLISGMKRLESFHFDGFPDRLKEKSGDITTVLQHPRVRVVLVFVMLGSPDLSTEISDLLDRTCAEYNTGGQMLEYRTLGIDDILQQIRVDKRGPGKEVTLKLNGWTKYSRPSQAYLGTVSAAEISTFYEACGNRLFSRNMRDRLGGTAVNKAMTETLVRTPEIFWHVNNGITILSPKVSANFPDSPDRSSVNLSLSDPFVVNGVQTIDSVYQIFRQNPMAIEHAMVVVRIFQAQPEGDIATRIAISSNYMNSIEPEDLAALDAVQVEIRDALASEMGKVYVLKRGQPAPEPDSGCSIDEAALALACAQKDAGFVARVFDNRQFLWDSGPKGGYASIFATRPSAEKIWRTVQIYREINEAIDLEARRTTGRRSAILRSGALLVTHIVLQIADSDRLASDHNARKVEVSQARARVPEIIDKMISSISLQFGESSYNIATFKNPERCRQLADSVLADTAKT